jgi:hypothetical protein
MMALDILDVNLLDLAVELERRPVVILLLRHQPFQFGFVVFDNLAGYVNDHLLDLAAKAEGRLVDLRVHRVKGRITAARAQHAE